MITLIVGTNRPGSNTRKVAKQIEEIYTGLKVPLHVLDLAQLPSEIFSSSSYAEKPKSLFENPGLGSTGHWPVPSGDPPDGTGRTTLCNADRAF